MNTTTKTFVVTALIAIASTASLVFGHADDSSKASAKQEIVKLERVVVNGKRMQVETLPRVVVNGVSSSTKMARAKVCSETVTC